ncbi:hypothetical protein [Mucilaginibacter lappiensis]|uniref:Uncharacterized protein n=1 Tax=Mucilaginibacter lappiensis TaxID=354630 RepID=A0A841JCQ9_9SPHI|nr:hypothetical protein [Mucilaginibacter lappiensis]MBB6128677.1 hypothetical protein [Mucilaginibacter lappiensis]
MFNSHIKALFKKYLLAFGFMVSFFALPGYVSQNIPGNNRVWGTELFSDKNFLAKGGISYKRAALAFYTNIPSSLAGRKYAAQRINADNRLTITRHRYLKQLFLSTKHYFTYNIDHLYRAADHHDNATFFQIG